MPFRSPKMNGLIFGFQRFVWWPKRTPASSRSFPAIGVKLPPTSFCLALAELEALTRAGHAVLLAFLDPRIPRQEPGLLQARSQLEVVGTEGAGDAEADGAGLAGDAAAGRRRDHVELVGGLGEDQGDLDDALVGFDPEGFRERPRVDLDRARAGPEEHAGRGAL